MNKKWLEKLAALTETKYGLPKRDQIFGDIPRLPLCPIKDNKWLTQCLHELHNLNDTELLAIAIKNLKLNLH